MRKKVKIFLFVIASALTICTLAGCSLFSSRDKVVGKTYKCTSYDLQIDSEDNLSDYEKSVLRGRCEREIGRLLTFNEDGTLSGNFVATTAWKTWSAQFNTVQLSNPAGDSAYMEMSGDRLTYSMIFYVDGITQYGKGAKAIWYLEKIEAEENVTVPGFEMGLSN